MSDIPDGEGGCLTSPAHYGRIRHELDRAGHKIGAMDLLIAAHAIAVAATEVPDNLAHFQGIWGLSVVLNSHSRGRFAKSPTTWATPS